MNTRSILFIGNFYSPKMLETIKEDSKGSVAFAAHNYEMSLLRGFMSYENLNVTSIVVPAIYSYPKYHKHWYIQRDNYTIERIPVKSIGFINLPVFKDIWRIVSLFIMLFKYVWKQKEKNIKVFVCSPNIYILLPLFAVKSLFHKKIDITLLIMDIPQIVNDMDNVKGLRRKILSAINKSTMKKAAKCDNLVLMTEQMMDYINKDVPHIIVEGIVDVDSMSTNYHPLVKMDKEIILYTGTLRAIFGVRNLVDAFEMANLKNTELWICGSGDSKEYIEERAKLNTNIKFFGLVDSKVALDLQAQATILVNPRTSEGRFTKYSFPSKTTEYLLAGKSAIINKLPGIPKEYYQYVYTPSDESVTALAKVMKDVVEAPFDVRREKAQAGRDFIINQKNSHVQAGRVLDLMFSVD